MNKLVSRSLLLFLCLSPSACGNTPKVQTAKVERFTVEATVSSVNSGTVRAEKIAELAFGAVGRVKTLNVSLGDRVAKGAVLAEIENTDLKVALEITTSEFQRRQQLKTTNAMSQSNLDEAKQLLELARSNYEKSLIIAPYDGIIGELNIEVGQLSQITAVIPKAMIRIVDLAPRYVRAEVDEVDLSKIKEGMRAQIRILAVRRAPFRATVRRVVPFVSTVREQDRTSEIELDIENEGILLPAGASADVDVIVEVHENTPTLPTRTILGRGVERFVYRVIDGKLRKTSVKSGIFNYDRTEILEGLSEGEIVAFPGEGFELSDGQRIEVARE